MIPFAGPVLHDPDAYPRHFVPIPPEVDDALDGATAVTGTLAAPDGEREVSFRRAVHGRKNGAPRLLFGQRVLADAGLRSGDTALLDIEPADPDAVDVPDELAAALAQDSAAAERFATFTPGKRRTLAAHVASAKRPDTRVRRALDLCDKVRTHTLHSDLNG